MNGASTDEVSVRPRGFRSLPNRFGMTTTIRMQKVCRLCCNVVTSTHCLALFSKESLQKNLPGRLSKLLELPVSSSDGLSAYLCRSCVNKFHTAESKLDSLRTLARAGYEKGGHNRSVLPSSSVTEQAAKKRTKDTSGVDASPHTVQARPLAKRFTIGVPAWKTTRFPSL